MTQIVAAWQRVSRMLSLPKIRVLAYHSVGHYPDDPYSTSPQQLQSHLIALRAAGLIPTSMAAVASGTFIPQGRVVLTFDDGYRDFYEEALPVLRQMHSVATIFVVSGKVGRQSDWSTRDATRALMTWQEIRDCRDAGMDIQAHTVTHPDLTLLSSDAAEWELRTAQEEIANELGMLPRVLAYPFGYTNPEIAAATTKHYTMAAGLGGLWGMSARSDRWEIPRYLMRGDTTPADVVDIAVGKMDRRILLQALFRRFERHR